MNAGVTRRAFLGLCASTAAFAALGGTAKALDGDESLLRPPGSGDEAAFVSACIKCDRCRSVCPTGVISVATVEDGFLHAREPKLDFHRGVCTFCGKCEQVCATGAIGPFDPASDKIGVAIVQRDRCLSFTRGCTNCEGSCDYGALVFDDSGHPTVDAGACNGCGACENACTALVYGTFAGGTRRGIVVVTTAEYEQLGTTVVDGEEG
jgi:ferredoxin-type protein NapG